MAQVSQADLDNLHKGVEQLKKNIAEKRKYHISFEELVTTPDSFIGIDVHLSDIPYASNYIRSNRYGGFWEGLTSDYSKKYSYIYYPLLNKDGTCSIIYYKRFPPNRMPNVTQYSTLKGILVKRKLSFFTLSQIETYCNTSVNENYYLFYDNIENQSNAYLKTSEESSDLDPLTEIGAYVIIFIIVVYSIIKYIYNNK